MEKTAVLGKRNYVILLAALAVLFIGFFIMTLDSEPYGFGTIGLTVGPAIVVLGLLIPFFSIFSGSSEAKENKNQALFRRLNLWIGLAVFGIALCMYAATLEPTASFWDACEFIACAYKLQVPHPPGAPLFLLAGRMFSLLALGDVKQVAYLINMLSALSSAFTILFLFWSIVLLAKKTVLKSSENSSVSHLVLIFGSGFIGALSYAFSDSFWFSAVEAEVYAMSAMFTAMVVWAKLKWEGSMTENGGSRWLILIAYLIGLSIGVHLLSLLTIPAVGFIYLNKKYGFSFTGAILTLIISVVLIGVVMWGVIPGLPALAGSFEIALVNAFGLPFGSGILVFLALFVMAIVFGLKYFIRKQKPVLQTALLCFIYILVGYSSYLIIPIRSAYNPPIDENNPEDIVSFVSYLRREQYGDRPLLYGPQFSSEMIDQKEGKPVYARIKNRYEVVETKIEPVYDPKGLSLLPRLYSNSAVHLQEYKKWVNIEAGQKPTLGQNLNYLFRYQFGHMFWRYFLWNFAGRQSDKYNAGVQWPWQRNQELPHDIQVNKANNKYYMLPLLLGLAGCIFHFRKHKPDAFVVLMLFLFTGLVLAVFLNQPPVEPRERDYAYAGAFYAFSFWVGLGVPAVYEVLLKILKTPKISSISAVCISLVVPAILIAQGYDDHDRSGRYIAADFARNVLESCPENAILFTNGDNDTFPLWYLQEVEGVRTDVRVLVMTYLNTDWYISQLTRPAYKSEPLPLSLKPENYMFSENNHLPYVENAVVKNGIDLKQFLALVKDTHPALQVTSQDGRTFTSLPSKKFFLNINKAEVLRSGLVPEKRADEIIGRMEWSVSGSYLEKKNLIISDIIATNNWQRPICFSATSNSEEVGTLKPYLYSRGFVYQLLPIRNAQKNTEPYLDPEVDRKLFLEAFRFRNLNRTDIYFDDIYQSQLVSLLRQKFGELARHYMAAGNTGTAISILNKSLAVMPDASLPFDYAVAPYIEIYARSGEHQKADALYKTLLERVKKGLLYYSKAESSRLAERETQANLIALQHLAIAAQNLNKPEASELENLFMQYYSGI